MYDENFEFQFEEKTPDKSINVFDQIFPREKKIKNKRDVIVHLYLTKDESEKLKNVSCNIGASVFVREALRKLGIFN